MACSTTVGIEPRAEAGAGRAGRRTGHRIDFLKAHLRRRKELLLKVRQSGQWPAGARGATANTGIRDAAAETAIRNLTERRPGCADQRHDHCTKRDSSAAVTLAHLRLPICAAAELSAAQAAPSCAHGGSPCRTV